MRAPRRPLVLILLCLIVVSGMGVAMAGYRAYGCLPEGRSEVFKNFTLPVTGALVTDVRTRTAVTIADCEVSHVELLSSVLRYRAEAGAYRVTVQLEDGAREPYLLTPGDADAPVNATRWYDHAEVSKLTYTGVSHDGVVSSNELPRRTVVDMEAQRAAISSVTTSTSEAAAVEVSLMRRLLRMP